MIKTTENQYARELLRHAKTSEIGDIVLAYPAG